MHAELFCAPASDGTPLYSPNYSVISSAEASSTGLIEDSFLFVVTQLSVDEALEMPLAILDIDKNKNWKRL